VIVALDDRERSFDIRLGPLDGAERPEPSAGRSLRDVLDAAGEHPPPFSFDPDRLKADLEPWAEALRRHAAGPLNP
jgi:FXSXX-COOH protein